MGSRLLKLMLSDDATFCLAQSIVTAALTASISDDEPAMVHVAVSFPFWLTSGEHATEVSVEFDSKARAASTWLGEGAGESVREKVTTTGPAAPSASRVLQSPPV